MKNGTMGKIGMVIYKKDAKKSMRDGYVPVYLRITKDGKKTEGRFKESIPAEFLDKWDEKCSRYELAGSNLYEQIGYAEKMFRRLKEFEPDRLAVMSIQQIRDELLNKVKPMSEMTILDYVDEYYSKQVENSDLAEGSKRKFRKAITHLKEFSRLSNNDQKLLVNLDYSYADEFLIYLKGDKPHLMRKGMTNSSAITIIKVFIRMFNQAFYEDKIAKNYFPIMLRNRKIKNDTQKRQGLTIEDIKKLKEKMPELSEREQKYLKQFLFLCFTSCAFGDSQALSINNLQKDENGLLLRYRRIKLGDTIGVEAMQYLIEQAKDLIDDLMVPNESGKLLPLITQPGAMNREI